MKFAVYQTNKPATCFHHNFPVESGWKNCVFESLEKAIKYAQLWCGPNHPVIPDDAKSDTPYSLLFEGLDGITEFIVIRSYQECVHTEHCCDVHKTCKYGDEDKGCPCCQDIPIPATHGCNCFH